MTKLEPYEWQIEDQRVLRANGYTGLVGIEPGGGKSLTATLAIRDGSASTTLIISPHSTHYSAWIPTLRDNAGIEARVIGNGKKAHKEALLDLTLGYEGAYLVTPQLLTRMDTSAISGDLIIHDESHQGSTPGSKLQRKLGGYDNKDPHPLAHRFDARLALSGTPFRQNFANAFGTMRFLWGDRLAQRGQVAGRNFIVWQADRMSYERIVTGYTWERTRFPLSMHYYTALSNFPEDTRLKKGEDGYWYVGKEKTAKNYLNEAEPGRLMGEMPCVIVHKRREQCCQFHGPVQLEDGTWTKGGFLTVREPQIIEREVILTAPQKKAVREMESMMFTFLKENPLVAEISLTQKLRMRQLALGEAICEVVPATEGTDEKTTIRYEKDAKSPVIDEVLHILGNLPEEEAVIVHLESQQFAEVIVHQLRGAGYATEEYSGVRKADLTKFGTDYQVLVGVISALGTGTDGLQAHCNTEIFAEPALSLTNDSQVKSRLDRAGARAQTQRYIIIDDMGVQTERILANVEKQAMMNRSLRKVA
jgi:hypothetical protein